MIYGMRHARPYAMFRTVADDTPWRFAITEDISPAACASRICEAFSKVNFSARFGFIEANRLWAECALFSTRVAHSRFVSQLLVLLPSLWFTVGRDGSGSKNAKATSLWTNLDVGLSDVLRVISRYPLPFFVLGRIILGSPNTKLRTRPRLLISYRSNPFMGFQISMTTPGGV